MSHPASAAEAPATRWASWTEDALRNFMAGIHYVPKPVRQELLPQALLGPLKAFEAAACEYESCKAPFVKDLFEKAGNAFWHATLDIAIGKDKKPKEQLQKFVERVASDFRWGDPTLGTLTKTLLAIEDQLEAKPGHKVPFKRNGHTPEQLFSRPSRLRCIILNTCLRQHLAFRDLEAILQNERIWGDLAKHGWFLPGEIHLTEELTKSIRSCHDTLKAAAKSILDETVTLPVLRMIRDGRAYNGRPYENSLPFLCKALGFNIRGQLSKALREVNNFDQQFWQLQTFKRIFCDGLRTPNLDAFIERTHREEQRFSVPEASQHFGPVSGLKLEWLYERRMSAVFPLIWKQALRLTQDDLAQGMFDTDYHEDGIEDLPIGEELLESHVLPRAQGLWKALATSLEEGTAEVKDVHWIFPLPWEEAVRELETLGRSVSEVATNNEGLAASMQHVEAARNAERWSRFAPALLTTKEVLSNLFAEAPDEESLRREGREGLEVVMHRLSEDFAELETMSLRTIVGTAQPYLEVFQHIDERKQEYLVMLASNPQCLVWIAEQRSTEDFERLIQMATPNTKDPDLLRGISFLQQTRTALASLVYPEHGCWGSLEDFMKEAARTHLDKSTFDALLALHGVFDAVKDLVEAQSHKPALRACQALVEIFTSGRCIVKCSRAKEEGLVFESPHVANAESGETTSRTEEDLQELLQGLLMVDFEALFDASSSDFVGDAWKIGRSSSPAALREMLDSLREKLQLLCQCRDCIHDLFNLGYFDFRAGDRVLEVVASESVAVFEELLANLQAKLESWKTDVAAARSSSYFLNYFTMREICSLAAWMADFDDWESRTAALHLLRVVGCAFDEDLACAEVRRFQALDLRPVEKLSAIGHLLEAIYENGAPLTERPLRLHGGEDQVVEAKHAWPDTIWVGLAEEPFTSSLLGLYARLGRLPEAEELLLCSETTTLEELDLFLRRFFAARKHGKGARLFCLANFTLLSYSERQGAIELLDEYEKTLGLGAAASLVFLEARHAQRKEAALARRPTLPVESLAPIRLKQLLLEPLLGKTEVVTGEINGVGKTHHIYRKVSKIQEAHGGRPVLHHVAIHEATRASEVLQALCDDPTNPLVPTCIYLDLGHVVPSLTDTLLFELLVLGTLHDRESCRVYHRRTEDLVFVELPSVPGEFLARQLPFCMSLPRTHLTMAPERLEMQKPQLSYRQDGPFRSQYVEFIDNVCLIATGKELVALSNGDFNPHSQGFNPRWTFRRAPAAPLDFLYQELIRLCSTDRSPPSFLQFTAFANYFGSVAITGERWNMFQMGLLLNFDQGLKQFKHSFLSLLVETAKTFALRQVPKDASYSGSGQEVARPAESILERFRRMPSWDTCAHPVACFKINDRGLIIGASVFALQQDFVCQYMSDSLRKSLNDNDLQINRDWREVDSEEAIHIVQQIEGAPRRNFARDPNSDYVVTVDNLLKLVTIQQRLRYGLPTVVMGETGCGKTALVNFLCKILDFRLATLNVHGGITEESIIDFVDQAISKMPQGAAGLILFFDEINAANCLALFKSLLVDRRYGNRHLPDNVRVLACCNPYRKRLGRELEDVALTYQHQHQTQADTADRGLAQPEMKGLVYRVHPLPESLMDIVYNFGSLKPETERLYIAAMLRKELPRAEGTDYIIYQAFVNAFVELLLCSHNFLRAANEGESSVVSMRDIARAAKVFKWFLVYNSESLANASFSSRGGGKSQPLTVSPDTLDMLQEALVLTLGFCYHARLDASKRQGYREALCCCWTALPRSEALSGQKLEWHSSAEALQKVLFDTQMAFVSTMALGPGISLNEALRENLFMLLVSIVNQIPILLVGKPGCSKSLAMTILQANLRGSLSTTVFFKSLPALSVVTYQCSPLSTPEEITKTFQHARNLNVGNKRAITCVLLDEVGLAEESPSLPLKVLHRELEALGSSTFVGISNWALDSAKMNRCITLYRPAPSVKDLQVTAQGMVTSERAHEHLESLSVAVQEVCRGQVRPEFWGMRDFYATVRVINHGLESLEEESTGISAQLLMQTVQRNFGGRPAEELEICVERFFRNLGLKAKDATRYSSIELIQQNLSSPEARHLMLLTENNAALRLLFQSGLVDHGKAQIMFGSTFPKDQNNMFVAMQLQRVKTFMQQAICLILVHCDSLYESLYDLLNQHYMEHNGQRYVRIAHGAKAMKQCPIHEKFRIVVISETSDAYHKLPAPLLNRFEKHTFSREDLMEDTDRTLVARLAEFSKSVRELVHRTDVGSLRTRLEVMAGCCGSQLASLACLLRKRHSELPMGELVKEGKRELMKVMTPESMLLLAARSSPEERCEKLGFDVAKEYFQTRAFADLPSFAAQLVAGDSKRSWVDTLGSQVGVLTYSSMTSRIGPKLVESVAEGLGCQRESIHQTEVSLHDLSTITDIETIVANFYQTMPAPTQSATDKKFLIIHADPAAVPSRMIEYCRFHCEKARSEALLAVEGRADPASSGSMFVILVVYLSRREETRFSFDFDSNWDFTFLDSIARPHDCGQLSLPSMVGSSFSEIVGQVGLQTLLHDCCRSSVSKLRTKSGRSVMDWQEKILSVLHLLNDLDFTQTVFGWMQEMLNSSKLGGGMLDEERGWLEEMVLRSDAFAVVGCFRLFVYHQITDVIGTLFAVFLARLDRNGGLAALLEPSQKGTALLLMRALAASETSRQVADLALRNLRQGTTIDVHNDSKTLDKPFQSRFPVSWFVSQIIDEARASVERAPKEVQLDMLESHLRLTNLVHIGFSFELEAAQLDRYLSDFCAMHLECPRNLERHSQTLLLHAVLVKVHNGELRSVLEVHRHFWNQERDITFCCNLVAAAPSALDCVLKCIASADIEMLRLHLLAEVQHFLVQHLQHGLDMATLQLPQQQVLRESLSSMRLLSQMSQDISESESGDCQSSKPKRSQLWSLLKKETEVKLKTLVLLLEYVAIPNNWELQRVQTFIVALKRPRSSEALLAVLVASQLGRGQVSPFAEAWLLDVCLQDSESANSLEDSLLDSLCGLAAGLPVEGDWYPSGSFALALLRRLLAVSKGEVKEKAKRKLDRLLKESFNQAEHWDTDLAVRHCVLIEERAAQDLKPNAPANWPKIASNDLSEAVLEDNPERLLILLGRARWMLRHYAKSLGRANFVAGGLASLSTDGGEVDEMGDFQVAATQELAVQGLLMTEDPACQEICRSARLFLLKCIGRSKGMSFVRTVLNSKTFLEDGWIEAWRTSGDAELSRLADGQKLKWRPNFEHSKSFLKAEEALAHFTQHGDKLSLEIFAEHAAEGGPQQRREALGSLLLALCQECGTASASGDVDPCRREVYDWVSSSPNLPATQRERQLLRIFGGDASVFDALPAEMKDFYEGLQVAPLVAPDGSLVHRPAGHRFRFRATAHIIAAVLAAPSSSLLAALRPVLLEPESVTAETNHLPSMSEGIHEVATKELSRAGEWNPAWGQAKRWYKCTCGYQFVIAHCGQPMQESPCPECGSLVGGRNHAATAGTSLLEDLQDDAPGGYTLHIASHEKGYEAVRKCSEADTRTVRLLLHTVMYGALGAAVADGDGPNRLFDAMSNNESSRSLQEMPEADFVYQHLNQDWQLVVQSLQTNEEDFAAALHEMLIEMQKTNTGDGHDWATPMSSKCRDEWEEAMCREPLANMQRRLANEPQAYHERWAVEGLDSLQVSGKTIYTARERQLALPNLWGFRDSISRDAASLRMALPSRAQERYPVLHTLLQPQMLTTLPALHHLAGALRWQSLLTAQFGNKLTRKEAGAKTVQSVLEDLELVGEPATWQHAWQDFKTAWNIAWPHIQRHNCVDIPEHFRTIRLSEQTPLLYTIMTPDNEGICATALIEWLLQRHNDLSQLAAAGLERRTVSSRLLADHDHIKFSEDDLFTFIETRCTTFKAHGDIDLDYRLLENHLRQAMDRPIIQLEGPAFHWLSAGSMRADLAATIPQEALSHGTTEQLRKELMTPEVAYKSWKKVQMATSFLRNSAELHGDVAGAQLLSSYLTEVLQDPEELPTTTVKTQVQLKHLASFEELINAALYPDPMAEVPNKYRQPLPEDVQEELRNVLPQLPKADLRSAMASTALIEALRTECIGENTSLWDTLKEAPSVEDLPDLGAVMGGGVLGQLKMKHWVAVHAMFEPEL